MSTDSLPPAVRDFITAHRTAYLRSGGAEGHIVDGRGSGGRYFSPNVLIKFKGRKSGKTYITPLSYGCIGGEVVIVASKGGADEHPDWYLNVRANPEIAFQIATQAFRASWREPVGVERKKIWDFMVDCHPFYATYQAGTSRIIPVVVMTPLEEIPVFKETDITA
jgi:deazaflavin-dependent oxidoreductase (nitroreductase family)